MGASGRQRGRQPPSRPARRRPSECPGLGWPCGRLLPRLVPSGASDDATSLAQPAAAGMRAAARNLERRRRPIAAISGAPSWPIEIGTVETGASGMEPLGMPIVLTRAPCKRRRWRSPRDGAARRPSAPASGRHPWGGSPGRGGPPRSRPRGASAPRASGRTPPGPSSASGGGRPASSSAASVLPSLPPLRIGAVAVQKRPIVVREVGPLPPRDPAVSPRGCSRSSPSRLSVPATAARRGYGGATHPWRGR